MLIKSGIKERGDIFPYHRGFSLKIVEYKSLKATEIYRKSDMMKRGVSKQEMLKIEEQFISTPRMERRIMKEVEPWL